MDTKIFNEFCAIARKGAGLDLKAGKEALVAARVAKRLRILGLESERAYLEHLRSEASGDELTCFLDVISTNYTSFMREPDHFEALSAWARSDEVRRRKRLRLWCAAASSGEEPYSIAVTLLDALDGGAKDLKILATDISTRVLGAAAEGRYHEKALAPLSGAQRTKYFEKSDAASGTYAVRPEVRALVVLRRLNLSAPPFPMKGPLDVVFCRNVMIYFGRETRQALITEIERLLAPAGLLFTGHSESLAGLSTGLGVLRPSVYHKPARAGEVT